jgi:hypothetical protein
MNVLRGKEKLPKLREKLKGVQESKEIDNWNTSLFKSPLTGQINFTKAKER